MNSPTRIMAISDASLGFGSPQIPAFMESLSEFYNGQVIVCEPDDPDKPYRPDLFPDLSLQRILTKFHPHTLEGRMEYCMCAAREINKSRPEILVVFCTFTVPVLFKLDYRPKIVIYYAIESIIQYGEFDVEMNRHLDGMVDLIVFPEENRAAREVSRCRFAGLPMAIVYNCSVPSPAPNLLSNQRNGRLIHQGTLSPENTFGDYYLRKELSGVPVDLYGQIVGPQAAELRAALDRNADLIRYCGQVDQLTLAAIRKQYAYSIVIWNPSTERGLFAPSNKFFESIQDSVPPITAPHPQHKMLVQRYDCGLVMDDWSFKSFHDAIKQGLNLLGTDRYDRMVKNCECAVQEELNWPFQFAKVKRLLKPLS